MTQTGSRDEATAAPTVSPLRLERPHDELELDAMRPVSSRHSRQARNERRASRPSVEYDTPDSYRYLDEVNVQPPVQNPDDDDLRRSSVREDDFPNSIAPEESLHRQRTRRLSQVSAAERESRNDRRRSSVARVDYNFPDAYANLDELAVSPVQNPDESPIYEQHSLEEARSREQEYIKAQQVRRRGSHASRQGSAAEGQIPEEEEEPDAREEGTQKSLRVSRLATQAYSISYLVFFSILGTLARLGLQALTVYPGAPIAFGSLWPNFAGSLFMGFLAEDRMLFRFERGTPTYHNHIRQAKEKGRDEESGSGSAGSERMNVDLAAARKAYMATKRTIPLYIGLATGFCGSFTSFSSFIRDMFLALSNDLPVPGSGATAPVPRNGGQSFMALVAVVLATVALSLSGLFIGAHIAISLEPITPSLPYLFTRKVLDRSVILVGWGCWIGAVLLSVLPPDRDAPPPETWRGSAVFALVFAPLGCLARFYASLYLNGRISSFPLGTFVVNVLGTCILAMSWDLAHVPLGGVIGCQVLQGIEDGFCGCLTTVSTWVAELAALRRRHAYIYGVASVVLSLALMVGIMGGLRWSHGFSVQLCVH